MKKLINLCLLLCCIILVSCKNKEYEDLKLKFETLQKDKEAIELEKNNLQTEYDSLKLNLENLKQEYTILETQFYELTNKNSQYEKDFENLQKNKQVLEQEKNQLSKKLESSKLAGKSENEIQKIKHQEIQEKLNTFGLKSSEITTYWECIKGWFNSFEIYPCIEFELVNTSKKRLDSIILNVSFDSNFGDATVIVDNLHPGHSKIIHLQPSVCKKVNGLNTGNIPNIEGNIKMTINDKTETSIGVIQIAKEYRQLK